MDDFLWRFLASVAPLQATLLVVLFMVINVPVSWHKCVLNVEVKWLGLIINFRHFFLGMPVDKIDKAIRFLSTVRDENKVKRSLMDRGVGLLLWISDLFLYLRPWLAEFYKAMSKAHPTLLSASRSQLTELLSCCSESLCVITKPSSLNVGIGWRLMAIGGNTVMRKTDAMRTNSTSPRLWLRMSNPRSPNVAVDKDLQRLAERWRCVLQYAPPWRAMLPPSLVEGVALAADAWAAGQRVGIGGWIRLQPGEPDTHCYWFSLQFMLCDFPEQSWEIDRQDAQKNIACWELLAQTALLVMCIQLRRHRRFALCTRQCTENSPTEGALNKLFTTSTPLSKFVQVFACWASAGNVSVEVNHIPGEDNDLADGLSRAKPSHLDRMSVHNRFDIDLPALLAVRLRAASIRVV